MGALVFTSDASTSYAEGGYVDDGIVRKRLRAPCPESTGQQTVDEGQIPERPMPLLVNR